MASVTEVLGNVLDSEDEKDLQFAMHPALAGEDLSAPAVTDSEEEEHLQHQAFVRPSPLAGEDLSAPPMNGEQYLRRVIEEAKKCEGVVVANIGNKKLQHNQLSNLPDKKECSSSMLPSKDCQISAMADFSQLRLDVDNLRKKVANDPYTEILRKSLPHKDDDEEWLKIVSEQSSVVTVPSTRFCLAMSQMKIWHLLAHLSDWLSDGMLGIQNGCRWVYCLLVCLELPVEPDIYFTLRQIARALINRRAQLESPESDELPHINLLVCIIGRYFSQTDLADPFI